MLYRRGSAHRLFRTRARLPHRAIESGGLLAGGALHRLFERAREQDREPLGDDTRYRGGQAKRS